MTVDVPTLRIIFVTLTVVVFTGVGVFALWLLSTTTWSGRWAHRQRR